MRHWVLGFVALAALLLGLGEPLVCIGFLALPFAAWRSGNVPVRVLSVVVAAVGLALHVQGYKLFGSAQVVATPPLEGAAKVAGLEPPACVRFANGGTATLEGVYFPQAIDLSAPGERTVMLWYQLGERARKANLKVRTCDGGRRGECLRRNSYWCGNTFFPTVLPRRLPSHTAIDFAPLLVQAGLALPYGRNVDRAYEKELLQAFDRSTDWPSYPALGVVSRRDETAVALGTRLIHPESRLFVAGAYLLIAAQEVSAYPAIEREIRRRQQRNRDDYDAIAQARSSDLDILLAWVNEDEARRRMLATPPPSPSQMDASSAWGTNAAILASHGDLSGFDRAVASMSDEGVPESARRALSAVIPLYFKWQAKPPLFSTWYAEVRPRLSAGRDELGRLVFRLDDGETLDEKYHRSMEEVRRRSHEM